MKNLLILFFACFVSFLFAAPDTTRYTVMTSQHISGKQLMWSDAPGKVSYKYEYNDRGRGPSVKVDIVLENGQVISRQASGVNYYKGVVNDAFEINAGTAKWKNKIEEGYAPTQGQVVYAGFTSAPGEMEWALKLLLKQTPHEAPLLPSGKLSAKHVKSHSALINGFREELELYAFHGSGGPPVMVWFTPKKEYFATIGDFSTIKQGYEFLIPELRKLQDKVEADFFVEQTVNLMQTPETPVAIVDVNVFDSKTGKVKAGQTVIIDKGKITQVGKSKSVTLPAGAKTIAGNGKMLLPGLWDNHVHFNMEQGVYMLAAGITNVKDMGNSNSDEFLENKARLDKDDLMGPEISIMSGVIDFDGPYASPGEKNVKTLDEGIKAVNFYADKGYQQIKLYSSVPPDWVKPLAAEAHKRGLKVCGHIPSGMLAERAINDGYDQIIHVNMIMLNFLSDTIDTRSMGRFNKVGAEAGKIDLNKPEVKRFISLLKEKKTVIDPTIAIFEDMFTHEPGKITPGFEHLAPLWPVEIRRELYRGDLPAKQGHESEFRQSFDNMLKMVRLLQSNKITFVPGTDKGRGFTLHRELELYAKAGVPNAEVLRKATYISAQVAGKDNILGSIEVGKNANLILVDGDPVKNISDIRKIEITICKGNIYDAKKLYHYYGFGFWK